MSYEGYVVGLPNMLREVVSSCSGSSLYTQPVANLQTARPSEFARLPTCDPTEALINWYVPSNSSWPNTITYPEQLDVFALVGVNFTPGATFRLITKNLGVSGTPTLEDLAPDAIAASTNATGAVTSIDEDPFSLDALKVTQTSFSSSTTVRVSFPTPAATPSTGANLQAFYVAAKGNGSSIVPTINVKLYESGGLVSDLGTQSLTVGETRLFGWYWNASLLGTASGANVEALITISATDGGTPSELHAIKWTCDQYTGNASYDSGYVSVPAWNTDPHTGADISSSDLGPPPQRTLRHILGTPQASAKSVHFYLRDLNNADGYLQAGVAIAGRKFAATYGPFDAGGDIVRTVDGSIKKRTGGGQILSSQKAKWDELELRFRALTTAEAFSLRDRLSQRRGTTQPVLVISTSDGTAYEQQYLDKYGVLKAQTAMKSVRTSVPHWEQSFTLEEAL